MSHATETLTKIRDAVTRLNDSSLAATASALMTSIGYASPKTLAIETAPAAFLAELSIDPAKLQEALSRIKAIHFLFQLTGDELPALTRKTTPQTGQAFQRGAIDSFVLLAVDLDDGAWSRRELVTIVREVNRGFAMPAIILFRHGGRATLAVIDRRANRRDPSRDVVGGRISLVKDIDLAHPHRAHVEILADLSLAAISRKNAPSDFRELYTEWLGILSAAELNKRFYAELADWFAWASTTPGLVAFAKGQPNGDGGKEVGLIRLLTRLMFVWFIKEKGLVPGELFTTDGLAAMMKDAPQSNPNGYDFYLAILQNLFFATLNTEVGERRWRRDEGGQSPDYLGHHVFRHEAKFADKAKAEKLFKQVPFLNGGLFECLDVEIKADDSRKALAATERQRLILRVDGFSDQPDKQPRLQNRIFFGGQTAVDLSKYYEKGVRPRDVSGLIDLFERYKFTIEENTPLEEEAALDPELLGKVFENLLASYNEDTKTTARNKSGSFYTPREVVDFMVDEALVAHLLPKIATPAPDRGLRPKAQGLDFGAAAGELGLEATARNSSPAPAADPNEARLRALLDYASRAHDFSASEVDTLIAAVESCKAIDPAVGSGAFPLGLLQKLVHALAVLDPGGEKWKARNRAYYEGNLSRAESIPAPVERDTAMAAAQADLERFDAEFASGHYPDYTRKLFLIERCLHGVDIQPIAVQIAKLRCFISLAVEQKADDARPNRGITPLPNLETKLVAANTLTPLHRKGQMQLRDTRIDTAQAKLREANRRLFAAANGAAKRKVQKDIRSLREELVALLTEDRILSGDEAKLLAIWDPFDPNAFAPFFDAEWMFGLPPQAEEGWFDIALANPPYIRQEKIEGFKINGVPVVRKADLKRDFKTFAGTADIYVYFYERALRLLKPEGALAFITSNKWYRAKYGKGLRGWLVEHARIRALMDFGDAPVFEAIAYPTILIATRKSVPGKPAPSETIKAMNWTSGEAVETFPARFAEEAFAMPQADLSPTGWQMEPQAERDLLARLRATGKPLTERINGNVTRGVTTGFNDAFVLNGTDRDTLIRKHKAAAEIIVPYIGGRDINKWQAEHDDNWLIRIESSANVTHPWTNLSNELAEASFKRTWPSIHEWFQSDGRRQKLIERDDQGRFFWEMRSCSYWDDFLKPKVVSTKISVEPTFAVDDTGLYLGNTSYFFQTDEAETIAAILNSNIGYYYSKQIFVQKQGGFYEVQPTALEQFPIPDASDTQSKAVRILVRAIRTGASQRSRLESLLNAFVYELFFADELRERGLSPFAAARAADLETLAGLEGDALVRAADEWSACISDPAHPLYATMFDLQSIDAIRIIEGRG